MLLGALVDAGRRPRRRSSRRVDAVIAGLGRGSSPRRSPGPACGRPRSTSSVLTADPPHRTWSTIRDLLADADAGRAGARPRRSPCSPGWPRPRPACTASRADEVHFHEVGALDSIADVVGVCAALHDLGVDTLSAGAVAVGSGRVRTAHGDLPVPVPAVAELARGLAGAGRRRRRADHADRAWPCSRALAERVRGPADHDRSTRSGSGPAPGTPPAGPTSPGWSSAPPRPSGRPDDPPASRPCCSRPTSTTSTPGCGRGCSPRCCAPAPPTPGWCRSS